MATLEKRGDGYRVIFYFRNQRFTRSLNTDKKTKADELRRRVEGNLELLEQGRIEYEPGKDDLPTVLLTDGRLNARPEPAKLLTLGEFFKQFQSNRPPGREGNTSYTQDIHITHLLRLMGQKTPLVDVPDRLQSYVSTRAQEEGRRGAALSHVTIKKELGTLTSIWNKWGLREKLVFRPLSLKDLEYPKRKEKPPFQTWEEIERKISQGASEDLWDSLFLALPQVSALLAHVRTRGSIVRGHIRHFPFVYPMFVFCAHTGARRSEMIRSQRQDFDFERNEVTIREKKKDRSKDETYRHVPMTPLLQKEMKAWFTLHPGGEFAFCKKAGEMLTVQMANHHFRWALEDSKWQAIRGWHCLRHSFVSNLACRGIDQRVIMGLVGHLNSETTRRYSHLFPSSKHDAIRLVFGDSAC
jgi:integrase